MKSLSKTIKKKKKKNAAGVEYRVAAVIFLSVFHHNAVFIFIFDCNHWAHFGVLEKPNSA